MKKYYFLFFVLFYNSLVKAQFVTSGNDVYSPATQRVGIGGISSGSKLQVVSGNALDGIAVKNSNGRFAVLYSPSLTTGAMNPLSQNNDAGIIFGTSNASADFGFVLAPWSNSIVGLRMTSTGNVGIGTATPSSRLSVHHNASNGIAHFSTSSSGNSWLQLNNAVAQVNLGIGAAGVTAGTPYLWSSSDKFVIGSDGNPTLYVNGMGNGKVGIGTSNTSDPNYKLFVETGIRTRKVKVDITAWPDYVFAPSYRLPSLPEVESYIQRFQHLPDVPSAMDVETNGLDLGENQKVLLKKVEELTLYAIEQQKQLNQYKLLFLEQDKKDKALEARLKLLEAQLLK